MQMPTSHPRESVSLFDEFARDSALLGTVPTVVGLIARQCLRLSHKIALSEGEFCVVDARPREKGTH